jgi:hypothetical protein
MARTSLEATLKRIKKNPAQLRTLRERPQDFAERLSLSKRQLKAISSAESLIITGGRNPLAGVTTITFTTGSTITASPKKLSSGGDFRLKTTTITFTTGSTITGGRLRDPRSLRDLTRPQLEQLFERVISDRSLADRVRVFLGK